MNKKVAVLIANRFRILERFACSICDALAMNDKHLTPIAQNL